MLSDCATTPAPFMTDLPTDSGSVPAVLEFPEGLPGFPSVRRFELGELDNMAPFCVLKSLDMPGLQFVVVPPGALFENYVIEVPEDDVAGLELAQADDALVLVIVTVSQPPTVNLLGPVVVNRRTGRSRQVVLIGSGYEVRTPLAAVGSD